MATASAAAAAALSPLFALLRRGVISRLSAPPAELEEAAAAFRHTTGRPPAVYAGFDPTAHTLHLGHLAVINLLRRLQLVGWRPIVLVGGATALIGDPTGRTLERPLLSEDAVASNARGLEACLRPLLDFSDLSPTGTAARLVNNAAFYENMSVTRFLRDVGVHCRVNAMLAKDSVSSRMEATAPSAAAASVNIDNGVAAPAGSSGTDPTKSAAGLSFAEFSYQIFQAADFRTLRASEGCLLQVGGADQWGNITAGLELIRRSSAAAAAGRGASAAGSANTATGALAFGATVPLLSTRDGRKFGKSDGNALWLTSPGRSDSGAHVPGSTSHALYQYLLSTPDDAVRPLLTSLTLMGEEQIAALVAASDARPESKSAQTALAEDVVLRLRGAEGLRTAQRAASALFGGPAADAPDALSSSSTTSSSGSSSGIGGSISSPSPQSPPPSATSFLSSADLEALADAGDVPCVTLTGISSFAGKSIADVAVRSGVLSSKAEARRLIAAGGLYLNGARVASAGQHARVEDLLGGCVALLRIGKRSSVVLRVVQ